MASMSIQNYLDMIVWILQYKSKGAKIMHEAVHNQMTFGHLIHKYVQPRA